MSTETKTKTTIVSVTAKADLICVLHTMCGDPDPGVATGILYCLSTDFTADELKWANLRCQTRKNAWYFPNIFLDERHSMGTKLWHKVQKVTNAARSQELRKLPIPRLCCWDMVAVRSARSW